MLITDDRRAVPISHLIQVASEARARELAGQKLGEDPHRVCVEVYDGDTLLFVLGDVRGRRDLRSSIESDLSRR